MFKFKTGSFTAKLELPRFIPKEEILGKEVFDSEILYVGSAKDWTYSSDGIIKMVIKAETSVDRAPILIPFYHIDRVGEFIMLKIKRKEFTEKSFDKIAHKNIDKLADISKMSKSPAQPHMIQQ